MMMNKNKYKNIEKKGEGTFSEVYKAQNVERGTFHAIKFMKETFRTLKEVNNLKEIQALRKLSPHPNIVNLQDVLFDPNTHTLGIVFELMDKNLYDLISGRRQETDRPFDSKFIMCLAHQLFTAIDHTHNFGIFHRDIKPENILVNESTKILKLADFGSCRGSDVEQPVTGYIATRWYRAPENLLTDGHYGPPMDIWGAGSVLYELISLYPLFSGSNEVDQLNRIHKVLGTPPPSVLDKLVLKGPYDTSFGFPVRKGVGIRHFIPHVSLDCVNLITSTLIYDYTTRITAQQILVHPYFETMKPDVKTKAKGRLFQSKPKPISKSKTDASSHTGSTKPTSNLSSLFRPNNKTSGKNKISIRNGPSIAPNRRSKDTNSSAMKKLLLQTSSSGTTKTTAPFSQESKDSTSPPNRNSPEASVVVPNKSISFNSSTESSSTARKFSKGGLVHNTPTPSPTRVPLTRKKTLSTNESLSERRIKLRNTRGVPSSLLSMNANVSKANNKEKPERPAVRKIVVKSQRMPKQTTSSGYGQSNSARPAAGAGLAGASSKKLRSFQRGRLEPLATQAKTKSMKPRIKKTNVEPAKTSIYIRPDPSKRQPGGNLTRKTTFKKRVGSTKPTGLGVKRYDKNAVQSSGYGRVEAHKSVEWAESAAATHAGTQITGDDTMAKTIESRNYMRRNDEPPMPGDTNLNTKALITASSSSSRHTPPKPENLLTSFDNGELKDQRDKVDNGEFVDSHVPGTTCLSGSIPDYIFVCQNWY